MAVSQETITAVKGTIRITTTIMDEEISDIIGACKMDLAMSGIANVLETDPLIKRAIIIYSKASFGMDNPDSEKYMASYQSLKKHLSLCGEYNAIL